MYLDGSGDIDALLLFVKKKEGSAIPKVIANWDISLNETGNSVLRGVVNTAEEINPRPQSLEVY